MSSYAHRIATGLPSRWHAVRDARTGKELYWRREASGYQVHRHGERFGLELDGQTLSTHSTLTLAIVAAREHMYARSKIQPTSNSEAT